VYEGDGSVERGARELRAQARGEALRDELLARLEASGPQDATELLPQVEIPNVSLSEIAFQLDRLVAEGQAVGEEGKPYRLG
jgi:hypothetical protein